MSTTVYRNAKIFTADPARPLSPCMAVHDGRFLVVGCEEEVTAKATAAGDTVQHADLGGALVIPGVIDGHFHLTHTGGSLQRVDLVHAKSLTEIQDAVRAHAAAHPRRHWVLGKSWLFDAVPGEPNASMLDEAVRHRPVLLDANDFHSTWVNSVALEALGITDHTPDPAGGRIARDASGRATGFLEETAAELAWDHLERMSSESEHRRELDDAVAALNAAGVTTVIDMGMGAVPLETISHAEERGDLDVRVVAHWLMSRQGPTAEHLSQVAHAAELRRRHSSDRLRVTGVKFVVDGVIDAKEQCDDGAENSDTLRDACRTKCVKPKCGDGVVDNGESCDAGAKNSNTEPDACRKDCRRAYCGDGIVDTGEECDGKGKETAACTLGCTKPYVPVCGDGKAEDGEECDDGNLVNTDECSIECKLPVCGNKVLEGNEKCDDGNLTGGDGCNNLCEQEWSIGSFFRWLFELFLLPFTFATEGQ